MAAPTVRQIREGVATRLATISGLNVFSHVPGQFASPAAVVGMPTRQQTETLQRGTDRWEVSVWIVVARQADKQSEKKVEQFLNPTGSTSVRAAIYGDTTLGGTVNDIFELSADVDEFTFGPSENSAVFIGLEFTYLILAAGKD